MQSEDLRGGNEVFTFKRSTATDNKLVNKNIPGVAVDQPTHIVECNDSQSEPTVLLRLSQIVRAENPLQSDACLGYFQVQVLGTGSEDTISIGLTAKDNTTKQHMGRTNNSFGYFKGDLFLNKRKVKNLIVQVGGITPPQKLKQGDYLGIGLNCQKRTFFLVKNGKIVVEKIAIPSNWSEYYPAVGVSQQNEKVKLIFNPKDFKFDYLALTKDIESQGTSFLPLVAEDIVKEQIPSSKIYPLVHEYLQFHGYTKTLTMRTLFLIAVTDRQKDYHKLPKYCKHPGISNPQINLISRESEQMMGEDEDMNQPLKGRHRIMSEIIEKGEQANLGMQVRRKNTEMLDENIRKQSIFSNNSNISNYGQSEGNIVDNFYREEQQKQMEDELNQNQKFLLNQKGEIVKLIKQKKIEIAMEVIEKKIPQLFAKEEIKTLMKGHIFLRIVKEGKDKCKIESNTAALMFSQKEKECFGKYSGSLFPFYSSQKLSLQWRPLKLIFSALAYNAKNVNNDKYADMVSDKQFQCFSVYINNLILKKMGYLGVSRLGFCVNNSKKVLEKLKSYKGMSCGVELKL